MAKTEATVEELVHMIERGELRLPEMQREYVWRGPRVRDLLDSLYRGYPSGAILVWETDADVPTRDFGIAQSTNPYQASRLLLDGQQRLTSLSAVLRGDPVTVRNRKKPVEILFNLNHPEQLTDSQDVDEEDDDEADEPDGDLSEDEVQNRMERMAFVVATRKIESHSHWIKVTDVFRIDSERELLKKVGISNLDDPRYERYSERLKRVRQIRKYVYRVDILERSLSYAEVTEIFVRVNSLGAKLRSSDLALAQITAKWPHSLEIFQEWQNRCSTNNFRLDLGVHLKNMVVFSTGQSRFQTVSKQPAAKLQEAWKVSCKGTEFAMNFMKGNVGIDDAALLTSPFLLLAVAFYGHQADYMLSNNDAVELRRWALLANAKGRFSRGSSETLLDQDLASIRQGGKIQALLDRLRQQVGTLDITPEELEGKNMKSSLFKTMFLAFRTAGATDWHSSVTISLSHAGSEHKLQYHHIFPKALLHNKVAQRDIDDVANLAFIGARTNRKISDKQPKDYLVPLIQSLGKKVFDAQAIPVDPELLHIDAYKDFLRERRKLIAQRLNEFIGV